MMILLQLHVKDLGAIISTPLAVSELLSVIPTPPLDRVAKGQRRRSQSANIVVTDVSIVAKITSRSSQSALAHEFPANW